MKEELLGLFDKEEFSQSQIPLVVFDLANNHNGDVGHGLNIIREISKTCEEFREDFIFGFKFQYRDLESFIHPDYKGRTDIKYLRRFSETRLTNLEFELMKDEIEKLGFVSVCTPFDESSVDLIEKQKFEIIKVASCSFTDWPLLERIVKTDKPIIASTAGATINEIDRVSAFFLNRDKKFCLMHCVAEYPTKNENLHLNQIALLKNRYKGINIGYSTHENPDNVNSIKLAIGMGASIFERHVALGENRNAYSATPEQVKLWLKSAKESFEMLGKKERICVTEKEEENLRGLRRAVFANRNIKAGERVNTGKVFYAIPSLEQQVLANDMSKYIHYYAQRDIGEKEPILLRDLRVVDTREEIKRIYHDIKERLIEANLPLPEIIDLELSHHYGINRFYEFGCAMINVINRDYCKKFILVLPGQTNPMHEHRLKEESFIVDQGDVSVNIDGVEKEYKKGDVILVRTGVRHSFTSRNGGIFEEISTTHYKNDSYYGDERITGNPERKTYIKIWLNDRKD